MPRDTAEASPLLELREAAVTVAEVARLAPVTARLGAGESLVVRGENGAGKTTLLRVIAGQQHLSAGECLVFGGRADDREPGFRAGVSALIGVPSLYPDLTVLENLRLVAATWSLPGEAETEELLDRLRLDRLVERFPHELSSGQTQLFRLAAALLRPHRLLILDEPEQRLDPERRRLVAGLLAERLAAGASLVIATHDPALAEHLAGAELTLEPA